MARPKKTEPKFDKQLKVYVTEEQYNDLVYTANSCGISVSALIQRLADKISVKQNYDLRQSALEFFDLKELSEEEHKLSTQRHIQRSGQARNMNYKKGSVQSEDLFEGLEDKQYCKKRSYKLPFLRHEMFISNLQVDIRHNGLYSTCKIRL